MGTTPPQLPLRAPVLGALVLLAAASGPTTGAPMVAQPGSGTVAITHPGTLADPGGRWPIDSVSAGSPHTTFAANVRAVPVLPAGEGYHWFRIDMPEPVETPRRLLLEVDNPTLSLVELYCRTPAGWQIYRTGTDHPFASRPARALTYVFPLDVATGQGTVAYLRVATDLGGRVPLFLWSEGAYADHQRRSHLALGLFYGLLGIMAVYHFFLYLGLRDSSYVYFVLVIAFGWLGWAAQNGLAFEFLWPDRAGWTSEIILALVSLGHAAGIRFNQVFLLTDEHIPRTHRVLNASIGVVLVLGASRLIIGLPAAFTALNILSLPLVILWLWAGVACHRAGYEPARYLLLACVALMAGGTLFALMNAGVAPATPLTVYGMQMGWAVTCALFAFGMAHRIRLLRADRARSQQLALEERLRSEVLAADSARQTEELEQARELQSRFLPAEVPRLDFAHVACHQSTATEVGGDYYDFVVAADGSLMGAIGDATGHGARAGLMVACTKSGLLSMAGDGVQELAYRLNTVLHQVSPGGHMYMALLIYRLARLPGGAGAELQISGGGMPPLYIVRGGGDVEEVVVEGLPLGAVRQTEYCVYTATLHRGDQLILLSDGLPERFDPAGEQLGYTPVLQHLSDAPPGSRTPAATIDMLVALGESFARGQPRADDETYVVIQAV